MLQCQTNVLSYIRAVSNRIHFAFQKKTNVCHASCLVDKTDTFLGFKRKVLLTEDKVIRIVILSVNPCPPIPLNLALKHANNLHTVCLVSKNCSSNPQNNVGFNRPKMA